MNKSIALIISLILAILNAATYAQNEKCSKPKVSVFPGELHPEILTEVYDFFQKQYDYELMMDSLPGFKDDQSEEDFYNNIQEYIFQTLKEYNPDVEFVPGDPEEGNYHFSYSIYLIAIELQHPESGSLYLETGYNVRGKFTSSDACGSEARVLKDKMSSELDLFQAVKNLAGFHNEHILRQIIDHEKKYLVPPRGPRIETQYARKSVSPLSDERKSDIQISVYNCKDEIVLDKYDGQKVYCPKNTDRGENNPTPEFPQELINIADILSLIIVQPVGASLTYELKRGVQPGKEKFEILTCGRDKKETKSIEIIIDGLEIQVSPQKPAIEPEEETAVDIYFNCVSPDGKKRPVAGKDVVLSVKGLVDGSISPSGTVTTDSNGKATLQYKAGKQDEKVTITASYQPIDYPDNVTGSGSVNVIPKYAWSGTIKLEISEQFNCNVEEKTSELGIREIRAGDEKRMVANIAIGMDDFDLPTQSTNAGSAIRYVAGNYTLDMKEDHLSAGRAEKTQCHNDDTGKWEWVSPGNWNTRHETIWGKAFRDIKLESLTVLIVKDIGFGQSSQNQMESQAQEAAQMAELQRQMQEAGKNMDLEAIEAMKNEMLKMVQGDKSASTFPVIIRVQLAFGGKPDPLTTTYDYQNYDVCLGTYVDNDSRSTTVDMPVVAPVGAEFKGEFSRGNMGQDMIKASVLLTENSKASFYSDICPDKIITIKGEITLERQKE